MAFWLIKNGIKVPNEWKYNPSYRLSDGETTAIKLVHNGIIPPKEWEHDPNIKSRYKSYDYSSYYYYEYYTVARYLKSKHIPVPNEWYDEEMKDTPKHPEFVQ